ncbi:hypothetical protein SNEBB_011043 [Seison nebaliae]|nr:hypothetical protein SNEBB_011043 [Seison nebaliae]
MTGYAIYMLYDMLPQKFFETSSDDEEEMKKDKKKVNTKVIKDFCKVNGTIFKYTGNFTLKLTNANDDTSMENVLNTKDLSNLNYCINKINPLPDQYVDVNVKTGEHKLLTLSLLTEGEKKRKLVWKYQLEEVDYELYFTMQSNRRNEITFESLSDTDKMSEVTFID